MRKLVLLAVATALTGSSSPPPARTPEAQAKLDTFLAGRVAGERKTCLEVRRTNSPVGIDDYTLLFRDGPRIWRNDIQAGFQCGKLDRQSEVVTESVANRLCSGDKLVILNNGTAIGACELGDFVPYTKP